MLFGLFENYTSTSNLKRKFPSLSVNKMTNRVFDLCLGKIKEWGFYNIEANQEYNDIYAEKAGYELSIQIFSDGGGSYVEMSVFGEGKRGRTRKFFKRYYFLLKSYLN